MSNIKKMFCEFSEIGEFSDPSGPIYCSVFFLALHGCRGFLGFCDGRTDLKIMITYFFDRGLQGKLNIRSSVFWFHQMPILDCLLLMLDELLLCWSKTYACLGGERRYPGPGQAKSPSFFH